MCVCVRKRIERYVLQQVPDVGHCTENSETAKAFVTTDAKTRSFEIILFFFLSLIYFFSNRSKESEEEGGGGMEKLVFVRR